MNNRKISIVIPTYNSAKTLEQTLQSILSQTYSDVEIIVIDGKSSDGTVDIIKKYSDRITYWVSERDGGIYDAMNKGITRATGDIIGILNSDDFYASSDVLTKVCRTFSRGQYDVCYGDIVYVNAFDSTRIVRRWVSGVYKENKLASGWVIPHPALFVKKSVYEKCGLFRTDFRIAGDYEFILRILKVFHTIPTYISETFVCMREGGASARSLLQRRIGWNELKKAWTVNNLKIPHFFILRRVFFKLPQFFSNK